MEHKSWLWKKKSIEKTMFPTDKVNRGNEDELQGILDYEAELERNLNISNEKLSTALAEIKAKDDIAKKQTNIAREAIQGWEKAEAEVLALKQELEKATQQTVSSEERLYGVDAALKECMQQLRFVREEQDKRIHDAVMKTSREYEKSRIIIEEKLSESNKKLSKVSSENTHLMKALLSKEKLINELNTQKNQLESDLSSLASRLESTQRDNASLSYEVRVMEKELEIRNEERDFNRRTADVAHKQHLQSVKRIAQLETEAQRLRVLVRKRLPGPAALAKMKTEVEMLGKKSNPLTFDHESNISSKKITVLTEQLYSLEEENKVLKEFITQKTNMSSSDIDEKTSMAESWAPSCKTIGASDIGLMDDFVEMEKLAVENQEISFDKNLIKRLIEIIEGVKLYGKDEETNKGYTVRVLQWKTSEINNVLETFTQNCNGLLTGGANLEKFVRELTLTLEWIVDHCFSLQDVSSMRDEMEKRFDWDEFEESKKMKEDLDNLESKLKMEVEKSECLVKKVKELEKVIESLEMELESVKAMKEVDVKGKEDLDEQLIEAIGEYNEVFEKTLEVEGQGSNNGSCSQELESRNLDECVLEKSMIERDIQTIESNEDEKRLQNEREIIAASEKLAECQETILNLGKQLKALASPRNGSVPTDMYISNPTYETPATPPPPITAATNHHRISLLDKMKAEDAARDLESTKTAITSPAVTKTSSQKFVSVNGIKHQDDEEALVNFLSIVPSKKKKSGVLRKLLWRRKKSSK
ncbi:hypothetical protein L2E82_18920 [Cichorium intybus]|uniref:Uncharacterized protein n=1 Tax=Cichorium intybus TaxID=13427 RepID=A0ACB9FB40_CICIN|nr:hypothetical protein L2E82_18920 [Cichorium intybus]